MSPSDDDLLDLAECINEGGPGPTSNIRRFQGLPTMVMREEHGQRVSCDPRQVTRVEVLTPPLPHYPPTRTSWADPLHPPPEDTPFPQVNYSSEAGIRKYLALASKSASEVAVMTQDDRGKRFWLNSASLRGQAAELVARAE